MLTLDLLADASHAGPDVGWPGVAIAADQQFQTPWLFIHTGMMSPGAGIGEHIHSNCEEIFFCLSEDGQAEFIHNGKKSLVSGQACVPVRCGESHGIYNPSDKPFRFYNINCCQPGQRYDCTNLEAERYNKPGAAYEAESPDRIPVGRFDRSLLVDSESIVRAGGRPPIRPGGGQGQLFAREMWGERDFRSCFRFLRQYALPPSTTVGPWRRELIEECFFVLSGEGTITVAGKALAVRAGDIVFAGLGETRHVQGPSNAASAELVVWTVGVAMDHGVDEAADCTALAPP